MKKVLLFLVLVLSSVNLFSQCTNIVLSKFAEGIIDLMVKDEIEFYKRYPLYADNYIEFLSSYYAKLEIFCRK